MTTLTEEEWKVVQAALEAPFDPELIHFKPQMVDYKNKKAMPAAHADPRAYIDRLNEVCGLGNWQTSYAFTTTPYTKLIKGKKAYKDTPATEDKEVPGNKVLCICTLSLFGVIRASTGDKDASDENAATSAEAQAFKRACTTFGLGRYLYDLPKTMVPYDTDKRDWVQPPTLPDWALPKIICEGCKLLIQAGSYKGEAIPVDRLVKNSLTKYGAKLCMACQINRAQKTSPNINRDSQNPAA